jgi:predicted amidohydrolase YtcJ
MPDATLVIKNANIITLNPKQPRAQAIAIQDNKITAVGSNRKISKYITKKNKVIDAQHKTIIPGLVDCHVHMADFGRSLQTLDLRNVKSIKEMQHKLRKYAKKNPRKSWILDGRWDQEKFSEKRLPTCWDLDEAVSDKPVFLLRVCGHAAVANSRTLKLAGITEKTKVNCGTIDLDKATGKPNGILRENTLNLIWKTCPKPSLEEIEKACLDACQEAVKAGLTCVHWLIGSANEARALQQLRAKGKLPLRVYLGIPVQLLEDLTNLGLQTGFGTDMIKIGFVKILTDGSLGARTAALKKPYADNPKTKGLMPYTRKTLQKLVSKAHKADLQLAIHAIGDRATETVIKTYEKALKEQPRKNHRHRIEHCSLLNTKLIRSMKELNLVASVQPHFAVSDFWIGDRVGENRTRWVYAFKTLMNEGVVVASGSDCPVEPISPILGLCAAVTRENKQENLTVEEALKTYTLNAAYASFDEDKKGSIEAGKLADLTVLSEDPYAILADRIKDVKVEMTIVDGKIVYTRKRFSP